jgi:hypothetical protein
VTRPIDVAVVAAALALLIAARATPVLVVALGALAGVVLG